MGLFLFAGLKQLAFWTDEYANDRKCVMWKYAHEYNILERMAEIKFDGFSISLKRGDGTLKIFSIWMFIRRSSKRMGILLVLFYGLNKCDT